jgi:hypothetical protein
LANQEETKPTCEEGMGGREYGAKPYSQEEEN